MITLSNDANGTLDLTSTHVNETIELQLTIVNGQIVPETASNISAAMAAFFLAFCRLKGAL